MRKCRCCGRTDCEMCVPLERENAELREKHEALVEDIWRLRMYTAGWEQLGDASPMGTVKAIIAHLEQERDSALAEVERLREALTAIMVLIESGQLQRNTSDDHNPDFGIRQIPFVMALAKAQAALAKEPKP